MAMKKSAGMRTEGMDMFGRKEGTYKTLKVLVILAIGIFAAAANFGYLPGTHVSFDKIWPLVMVYLAAKKIYGY